MIRVEIDMKTGNPTISVQGVKGMKCTELTRDLEASFGKDNSKTLTHEAKQEVVSHGIVEHRQ